LRAVYAVRNPFFKKDNDMTGIELKQLLDLYICNTENREKVDTEKPYKKNRVGKTELKSKSYDTN